MIADTRELERNKKRISKQVFCFNTYRNKNYLNSEIKIYKKACKSFIYKDLASFIF